MSETAFGSSPANAFIESPAGARDDPAVSVDAWAIATYCLAHYIQWGWNPFNGQLLNHKSFSARDKYLRQRRLLTNPSGETSDQTFTMDRMTGLITEGTPTNSAGWEGVSLPDDFFYSTEDSTSTHFLANARDGSTNAILLTVEMFNSTPNAFGLGAVRCAALLDSIDLDEYDTGDFINVFNQYNAFLPDIGTVVVRVTPRPDLGEFPYTAFHDLNQGMAYYNYQPDDFPAEYSPPLPPEDWFQNIGLGGQFESVPDSVSMLKSKVLMHGDLCSTIRRQTFTEDGLGENIEDIIKCVPFAVSASDAVEESFEVRFDPPCKQGYFWWFADAWPKHFAEQDGELVVIADYPTACDLLDESGNDPNCFTNPT